MPPKKRPAENSNANSRSNSAKPTDASGGVLQSGSPLEWNLNDKVLCRYAHSPLFYEAKITNIEEKGGTTEYTIHYQGWNSRHDEKIKAQDAATRFKIWTAEEARKAAEEVKAAQRQARKSKGADKSKSSVTGDDSSRASTPTVRNTSYTGEGQAMKRARGGILPSVSAEPEPSKAERENERKINLPESLRKILTDDACMINKNQMLPKIPARITVKQIVEKYRENLGVTNENEDNKEYYIEYPDSEAHDPMINPCTETLDQSALGILDYFDVTIGSKFLTKFERPLYSELYQKECQQLGLKTGEEGTVGKNEDFTFGKKKVHMSNYFGLPHLLRMFTNYNKMLDETNWSPRARESIIRHAQDFVIFLSKNYQDFFNVDEDYEVASPDYIKQVYNNGVSQ
ncbi:MRG domain-containing protein [Ditylenchus destructor]|nr:MRG domain-containing protein [Ditylenchus destructor]